MVGFVKIFSCGRAATAHFFEVEQGTLDYRLKEEFEREKDEINQACQKRIDGLTEYRNSLDTHFFEVR